MGVIKEAVSTDAVVMLASGCDEMLVMGKVGDSLCLLGIVE